MKIPFLLAIAATTLCLSAWAGDADAGKAKATPCTTCHGAKGISTLNEAPNLAGQPEIYLIEQLRAYRSGKRQNEMMAIMAKPLSNTDIEDLAAWYASIKIDLK